MTDPRLKRNVVRHARTPSQIETRRDLQQLNSVLHNSQIHQHASHDQNLQVPYQHQHQNSGVYEQFHSYEGLARYDDFGRPHIVQLHAPEVFHPTHHIRNVQNPQTFVQEEYNQSSSSQPTHSNHQHNLFVYGGVTVSHNQQQLTHDPRNSNQQSSSPHGIRDHYGSGFHREHDSLQVLGGELSQLSLTSGQTATSERPDDALFQKHSREHVKAMIELGNKKRIKHPGDSKNQQDSLKTNKLSLDIISEHHPVHMKPMELQIKTLPKSETLRRDAALGGYIFLCKDETMDLEIVNQMFVLPARYKDSVRAITPGTPLFLYNVTRHELHGIFEATGFGTYDTNPLSFLSQSDNDKFPARVACRIRKRYHALAEEEFRYALSHYDGPKFILQLSVPQVLDIITLFEEQQIPPQDRRYGPFSYCHRDPEGC